MHKALWGLGCRLKGATVLATTTTQPCHHSSHAGWVAAGPWDLGRASAPMQAVQLSGELSGKLAKFMLDSGATSNFLSSEWVNCGIITASCTSNNIPQHPDGSQIASSAVIPKSAVTLCNSHIASPHHQERLTFDVADLHGYDATLGKPWLGKHN